MTKQVIWIILSNKKYNVVNSLSFSRTLYVLVYLIIDAGVPVKYYMHKHDSISFWEISFKHISHFGFKGIRYKCETKQT